MQTCQMRAPLILAETPRGVLSACAQSEGFLLPAGPPKRPHWVGIDPQLPRLPQLQPRHQFRHAGLHPVLLKGTICLIEAESSFGEGEQLERDHNLRMVNYSEEKSSMVSMDRARTCPNQDPRAKSATSAESNSKTTLKYQIAHPAYRKPFPQK